MVREVGSAIPVATVSKTKQIARLVARFKGFRMRSNRASMTERCADCGVTRIKAAVVTLRIFRPIQRLIGSERGHCDLYRKGFCIVSKVF